MTKIMAHHGGGAGEPLAQQAIRPPGLVFQAKQADLLGVQRLARFGQGLPRFVIDPHVLDDGHGAILVAFGGRLVEPQGRKLAELGPQPGERPIGYVGRPELAEQTLVHGRSVADQRSR